MSIHSLQVFLTRLAAIGLLGLSCVWARSDAAPPPPEKAGAATAETATTPATVPAPESPSYRIQPFDTLQIAVFREADLSATVKVSPAGTIEYPLLGTIRVADLTLAGAQTHLAALLAKGYLVNPRVTVSVEPSKSTAQRVMVFGQVKSPGSYEILPDERLSLVQLIAKAGGFTEIAATDRVRIVRSENGKERRIVVNVAAIIKGHPQGKDIDLRPGDIVSVPETFF